MKKLAISAMARLCDVSVQTLRIYDKMNLLKPESSDPRNRYRCYNMLQAGRMEAIKTMKDMGFSLSEIKNYLDGESELIESALTAQMDVILREIENLNVKKTKLRAILSSIEKSRLSPPDGAIIVEYISQRTVCVYKVKADLYSVGKDEWEEILVDFRAKSFERHPFMVASCGFGNVIRAECFSSQNRWQSDEMFLFEDCASVLTDQSETLPAGGYLCIYADSTKNSDGSLKEIEYGKRLIEYAQLHRYAILGDCYCEVLSDPSLLHGRERDPMLKIQINVKL